MVRKFLERTVVMTISDLSHEQKLALVALLELFTMADGVVYENELKEINVVANALGDEEYRSLLEEAESHFSDVEMLKASLETIKEREAQELIFGLLLEDVMSAPGIPRSSAMLDWLKDTWKIEVR